MDDRTRTALITGITALILVAVAGYIILRPTAAPQPTAPYPSEEEPSGESAGRWLTENITLHPVEDAFVESYHPNDNYGSCTLLRVGDYGVQDPNWVDRSYIRFDILGNIPEGATIKSAKLRLYVSNRDNKGAYNFKICRVLEEWDESTITWNNKPDMDTVNPYYQAGRELPQDYGWVEYDVKQYILDVLADGWDYGLGLYADTDGDSVGDFVTYDSKEGSYPPELVITYEYLATTSWQGVLLTYGPWLALGTGLLVAAAWLLKSRGAGR